MQWFAQAPANIALIKYMGKKNYEKNIPDNPSLSYTLDNLLTNVLLEPTTSNKDYWEPLPIPGAPSFNLSLAAQQRFLGHLANLKAHFNYTGSFIVRSSNNFPHSSGLASSASSFAALTKCAAIALSELTNTPPPSIAEQANLSRLGSGSSCRSFFSPWALWDDEFVTPIELPYQQLTHEVILIDQNEKKVSSSAAHLRILTSPSYETRCERAQHNLKLLLDAFTAKNWAAAYQVCWQEFQDMHHLFSSCAQPFSYISEKSQTALTTVQDLWQREGDGPIVTMDAGPNIHLLYHADQAELARKFRMDYLLGNYDVL